MRFLIITHVEHQVTTEAVSAYAPYVREMNLWLKHVDEVTVVAPETNKKKSAIDLNYNHGNLNFKAIPAIQFTDIKTIFLSIFKIPIILYSIFKACRKADHIHLRCPGNIGMFGCFVQILFPNKTKTAKYAGNWDPEAIQPLSYKLQKKLLSSTVLTKKMTALVYGDWKDQTKNIQSFFTATFNNEERQIPKKRDYAGRLNFVFIGSLVTGKRPLFTIQIVEQLLKLNYDVTLDLYGDGILKTELLDYITNNNLTARVRLLGNQEKNVIKETLKNAHFLILPSKSEGWPKAVAEAMFFGAIPISTAVSCVSTMLNFGARGVIIEPKLDSAIQTITKIMSNQVPLKAMAHEAAKWSQKYTLDTFESEIIKLLKA